MKWFFALSLLLPSVSALATAPKQTCHLKFEVCEMGPGHLKIDYQFRLNSTSARGEPAETIQLDPSGSCFEIDRKLHSISYERSLAKVSLQLFFESEQGPQLTHWVELTPLRYTPGQEKPEGPLTCFEYAN